VPQEVALYPLLSARENLQAFGRLQGLSGGQLAQQVDWVLERTGLADRSTEPIKQFSGGMRRRLNIACGIVHRPRVVLLDEPTVGVDPQSRDRIYDVLADLRSTGVSLLLTTHHLEEAEARCSRTVIIDHGKVIASGTLPELVDRTVGRHRLVTLRVDAPLGAAVFTSGSTGIRHDSGIEIDAADPRVVRARLTDVGLELPPLLDSLRQAGRTVEDLDVRGPSLQAVFIHLTGRELRE
jgi:ABC-2 type transport system ATP-binding protein